MNPFVVIPAFNEEKTIFDVVVNVRQIIKNIIVVDDCSTDDTYLLAQKAGAITIKSNVNNGYDSALEKGFKYAASLNASSILTFDADGQHPYEKIKDMIDLVESGQCQLAIGKRSKLPRVSEKLFSLISNYLFKVSDITCGMKCYHINLYKDHGAFSRRKSIGTELALRSIRNGVRFISLEIDVSNRIDASRIGINLKSEISFLKAAFFSCFF